MTRSDELYEIGKKVDDLQQLNFQYVELNTILTAITELEQWFEKNNNLSINNDNRIVYNYTKANHMTVLIEIAQQYGKEVHDTPPYLHYKTRNDFLYDYGVNLYDDIHLPNMGIGYFAHEQSLSYYSWFNTLKQEFNQSRYFLYLIQSDLDYVDIHESLENVLLINTLDYPAIRYMKF